jgi:signal transduction histidine kinase
LTNVVSNAVKFTDAGAITLTIRYHAVERMVSIACRDTGIGIAPGDLETIFEEYRQAATVKRNKHGTGLGLSIARTIARHHGGSLTAESTQGVGSVFTLCLPVNPPSRPLTIDVTQVAASAMLRNHTRPGLSPGAEGTG